MAAASGPQATVSGAPQCVPPKTHPQKILQGRATAAFLTHADKRGDGSRVIHEKGIQDFLSELDSKGREEARLTQALCGNALLPETHRVALEPDARRFIAEKYPTVASQLGITAPTPSVPACAAGLSGADQATFVQLTKIRGMGKGPLIPPQVAIAGIKGLLTPTVRAAAEGCGLLRPSAPQPPEPAPVAIPTAPLPGGGARPSVAQPTLPKPDTIVGLLGMLDSSNPLFKRGRLNLLNVETSGATAAGDALPTSRGVEAGSGDVARETVDIGPLGVEVEEPAPLVDRREEKEEGPYHQSPEYRAKVEAFFNRVGLDAVNKALAKHKGPARTLRGELRFVLKLGDDGRVLKAEVSLIDASGQDLASRPVYSPFMDRLREEAKSWTLPEPRAYGAEVHHSFDLR